ncbi:MAG: hypothetical protein JNK38_02015 [Acidobacteria bacterium]|nr:hypothetical protein [Acidobacteriota bacterium]
MSNWQATIRKSFEFAYPIFSVLTILNFLVFVGLTLHLGGDALNGKTDAGRYFLFGYNAHTGKKGYTEVNEVIFQYSRWHAYSVIITWLLMLAGSITLKSSIRRKKSRG